MDHVMCLLSLKVAGALRTVKQRYTPNSNITISTEIWKAKTSKCKNAYLFKKKEDILSEVTQLKKYEDVFKIVVWPYHSYTVELLLILVENWVWLVNRVLDVYM